MNGQLLGVVLCGGRSSRMGQDKSLLPHPSGGTFASHAIERLSGICGHVCVCGGSAGVIQADTLADPRPYQGPVVGIATALGHATENAFDACLVTPVDMPCLTKADLLRLCDVWNQELKLCCAVSAGDGRLQPLVAVYPTSLQSALQELAESEDRSMTRWIQKQAPLTVALSAESCRNINTREDIADRYP